ncbi:GGDEF domain-containing protein [Desulfobotulus sp. H1]|uniref:diguanylate cyclase n=1 Tax=Desulfobotulus pelophilus TaxID=2823377 RepID=A0ABT3N963_9BACT|nr:GGDEF domain-containing protein [Desulfobotulus pelophilus]MCW7753994.1 GGDEF domain-containing protein [Desulfobotulus pelophilus]
MFSFSGITDRILVGIAALSLIAFTIGGMAFVNFAHVRSHADRLMQESLPQWAIAHGVHQEVAQTGFFMLRYVLHGELFYWEEAMLSTERCLLTLERGRQLAEDKKLQPFSQQLHRMTPVLFGYQEALHQLREAMETIESQHGAVQEASLVFMENMEGYLAMQWVDMGRQTEAVFAGLPLMRGELDLAGEEELAIRQHRLQAGMRILDMGRQIDAGLWQAELSRSRSQQEFILHQIGELQQHMAALVMVTRQPQNMAQLRAAMGSLEDTVRVIRVLVKVREEADKVHRDHSKAYETLSDLAKNIASKAHDSAMDGGSRTRAIAERFVFFLVPLALAGIGILLLLYAQVASLERQTLEMNQITKLAARLKKAGSEQEATACVLEACRRIFPKDSGMLILTDPSGNPVVSRGWGTKTEPPCPSVGGADPARKGGFSIFLPSHEERKVFLDIRFHASLLFPGQRRAAHKALARTVVDHFAASLHAMYLMGRLHRESITDALTGLYNRRYMEETLRREFFRCERKGSCLSLLLLDADHFKKVNDTHGHDVGDRVLIHLARLLKEDVRAEDVACRIGGEEFLLIMPGLCPEAAMKRAEAIRRKVAASVTYTDDGEGISLTVSLGLAVYPEDGKSPEVLIQAADRGLYAAKSAGRNRVCRHPRESGCAREKSTM